MEEVKSFNIHEAFNCYKSAIECKFNHKLKVSDYISPDKDDILKSIAIIRKYIYVWAYSKDTNSIVHIFERNSIKGYIVAILNSTFLDHQLNYTSDCFLPITEIHKATSIIVIRPYQFGKPSEFLQTVDELRDEKYIFVRPCSLKLLLPYKVL